MVDTLIELRLLAVAGLLLAPFVSYAVVAGAFAVARAARHAWEMLARAGRGVRAPARVSASRRCGLLGPDAERIVRARQSAWRLRC